MVIAEEPVKFQLQHPGISCLGPLGFSLNNKQETLKLVGRLDDTISSFTYYDSIPWLTAADGYGRTLEFNNPGNNINDPTNWFTGCMGGSPGSAYSPCEDELVISEINYNSADWADAGDWVELKNTTSTTINLSGWKFSDSDIQHLYTLPSGSNILPGEFMVLYSDAQNFATTFPWVNNKSGPFTFGLSGSGEALRLYDPSGKLRFSVIYDDESPWPTEPDGQGYTLELADVGGVMCDGNNWFAGCLQGSPGGPYVYPCHTAVDETEVSEFIVFPNPANSQLFILNQSNEDEIAEIQIMDTYGRLLLEKKMNFPGKNPARLQLDLLSTGIYFLKIQTENKDIPEINKVVISR
ncbi:MAG: lamin tail domain-containing protein [Bacteroidales bacterium]|nr:lamin tail domain-containing protein [Bacteroidales bacterium]